MLARQFLWISTFFLMSSSFAQKSSIPKGEESFVNDCKKIARALIKSDTVTLNAYVHPATGLFIGYPLGATGIYEWVSRLTNAIEDHSISMNFSLHNYENITTPTHFRFDTTIKFDCDTGWNKKGSFINTKKCTPISQHIAFLQSVDLPIKISKSEQIKINRVEKNIRKVICTSNDWNDIIFYMSKINGKWYLTIIDQLETSCDI